MNEVGHEIQLRGRYTRTIQIYLTGLLVLFAGVLASDQFQSWLSVLVVVDMAIVIPMLALYSKTIVVRAGAGRLYVRQRSIDVTRRIKRVQRRSEQSAVIRFNSLYQLIIKGSQTEIDEFLKELGG